LRLGAFEALHADADLLVLRRRYGSDSGSDTVLAAFNLGTEPAKHVLPSTLHVGDEWLALNGARRDGAVLHLPPGAAWIASA
jgi:hypothetical protein